MRSLFTEDIPGARPRNRYYSKELYLQRHNLEIQRYARKNPEDKRVIEWYTPIKKMVEPLDKNIEVVKPHMKLYESPQFGTANPHRPQHSVAGKVTEGISLSNSAVLSSAAKTSLNNNSFSRDMLCNPYFPHKPPGNMERLSGRRGWTD